MSVETSNKGSERLYGIFNPEDVVFGFGGIPSDTMTLRHALKLHNGMYRGHLAESSTALIREGYIFGSGDLEYKAMSAIFDPNSPKFRRRGLTADAQMGEIKVSIDAQTHIVDLTDRLGGEILRNYTAMIAKMEPTP